MNYSSTKASVQGCTLIDNHVVYKPVKNRSSLCEKMTSGEPEEVVFLKTMFILFLLQNIGEMSLHTTY
jgi:hypothetical protein